MSDLKVFRYKTTTMQRIQRNITKGYIWYTSGIVASHRALKLVEKFETLYLTNLNKNQRNYRKFQGKCNTRLYMYPDSDSKNFRWWLLATDGKGQVHELEKLQLVYDQKYKLQWNDDYEIVRVSKEGKSGEVITWRMTKKCRDAWYRRIQSAIRSKSDDEMKQTMWSLHRVPGFSEVRETVKKLKTYTEKEWKRSRRSKTKCTHITQFIPYVRHPDARDYLLSLLVKRMNLGLPPFPRNDIETPRIKKMTLEAENV